MLDKYWLSKDGKSAHDVYFEMHYKDFAHCLDYFKSWNEEIFTYLGKTAGPFQACALCEKKYKDCQAGLLTWAEENGYTWKHLDEGPLSIG